MVLAVETKVEAAQPDPIPATATKPDRCSSKQVFGVVLTSKATMCGHLHELVDQP
jgi:hypothetical protein